MVRHTNHGRRAVLKQVGVTAGVVGTGLLAGCTGDDGGEDVRLGMGASGSATHAFGTAVQAVVREESDTVNLSAQETAGSAENMRLVSNDPPELECSIPTDFVYDWGMTGQRGFEDEPIDIEPYQGGLPSYLTEHYLVAVDGSGIETWNDLEGANVWPLWTGASIYDLSEIVLGQAGYWDEIELVDVDLDDVAGVVEQGQIDALCVYEASGSLVGGFQQLDAQADLYHVDVPDEDFEQLQELDIPPVSRNTVGQDEPWDNNSNLNGEETVTWTNAGMNVWPPNVSEDVVYEVTKIIYENGAQISEDTGTAPDNSDPEMMVSTILDDHPIHPGAAQLFEEEGVWDDNWTVGEL